MLHDRSANLPAEASIALAGELDDGPGELGLDASADADEPIVHLVHWLNRATPAS